jgi:hypothetical protein
LRTMATVSPLATCTTSYRSAWAPGQAMQTSRIARRMALKYKTAEKTGIRRVLNGVGCSASPEEHQGRH